MPRLHVQEAVSKERFSQRSEALWPTRPAGQAVNRTHRMGLALVSVLRRTDPQATWGLGNSLGTLFPQRPVTFRISTYTERL